MKKHSAVGHKSQNMFLCLGIKNMISISNPGAVGLPKRIKFLKSLASDLNNTIFKMASETLRKGQNKPSVANVLNTAKISDASKISRLSSAWKIDKEDTNSTSSSTSTSRNEKITFSSSLLMMQLHSQVFPLLIDNYGITLVQWKMYVDTTKFKSVLQEIAKDSKKNRVRINYQLY